MAKKKTKQQRLRIAIDAAQDIAENAVGHVGVANYAAREYEAMAWVRAAFDEVNRVMRSRR